MIDTSPRQEGQRLLHLVNPEIVKKEGGTIYTEGCLSVPDMRGVVPRSTAAILARRKRSSGRSSVVRMKAYSCLTVSMSIATS